MSDHSLLYAALNESFPVVTALPQGGAPEAGKDGVRYIVDRKGLVRHIKTAWFDHYDRIAQVRSNANTPFGLAEQGSAGGSITLSPLLQSMPSKLWHDFMQLAKQSMPNECAGLFVYNTQTQTWRLAMRKAKEANHSYIAYDEPPLDADEEMVVDIHSHASHAAGFSHTDDQDDAGSIKISAVIGRIDSGGEIVARACCIDQTVALSYTKGAWHVLGESE